MAIIEFILHLELMDKNLNLPALYMLEFDPGVQPRVAYGAFRMYVYLSCTCSYYITVT